MKKSNPTFSCLAATCVALAAQSAVAQYFLVDDFESYTQGAIRPDGSDSTAYTVWNAFSDTANPVSSSLVRIEDDGGVNQNLGVGWNSGLRGGSRSVPPIADGATATYYWQVRTSDATPNASYGLSDDAAPTWFSNFEVQLALVDDGNSTNGLFNLAGRNGGATDTLATGLLPGTWYDLWVTVDNAADTYDVYFGATGDPNVLGALVGSGLAFRNGTTEALGTFMTTGYFMDDVGADMDNIFATVIPEPTTAALLLGGLGLLIGYRRSRTA